jgi:hypothetical protein
VAGQGVCDETAISEALLDAHALAMQGDHLVVGKRRS